MWNSKFTCSAEQGPNSFCRCSQNVHRVKCYCPISCVFSFLKFVSVQMQLCSRISSHMHLIHANSQALLIVPVFGVVEKEIKSDLKRNKQSFFLEPQCMEHDTRKNEGETGTPQVKAGAILYCRGNRINATCTVKTCRLRLECWCAFCMKVA